LECVPLASNTGIDPGRGGDCANMTKITIPLKPVPKTRHPASFEKKNTDAIMKGGDI